MPIIALPTGTQSDNIKSGTHSDILRIQDIDDALVSLWNARSNPLLYRIMAMLRKGEPVHDPTRTYFEDDKPPRTVALHTNNSEAAGTDKVMKIAANLVVAGTTLFDPNTGEWILVESVTSIDSATEVTLKVYRGWAGTTAQVGTITAAATTFDIGPTILPEGANYNSGITFQPTSDYNCATYFSESMGITDVQENSKTRFGVHTLSDQDRITTLRVMEQMDTQLRHGKRRLAVDTVTGKSGNVYLSDGFEAKAGNSLTLQGDVLDWTYLNSVFNPLWDTYTGSSNSKVALLGPALFDAIVKTEYNRVEPPQADSELGTMVKSINLTSGGQLYMIRDNWGFENSPKKGYIIDMEYVKLHEHAGMELQRRDVTEIGSHTNRREIFGSMLPIWKLPAMHAVVTWTQV